MGKQETYYYCLSQKLPKRNYKTKETRHASSSSVVTTVSNKKKTATKSHECKVGKKQYPPALQCLISTWKNCTKNHEYRHLKKCAFLYFPTLQKN